MKVIMVLSEQFQIIIIFVLYLMFEYFTRNQKAKNDLVKMFNQNKSKLKPDLVKWFESEFDDFLDDWEDELSEYAENDLMEE